MVKLFNASLIYIDNMFKKMCREGEQKKYLSHYEEVYHFVKYTILFITILFPLILCLLPTYLFFWILGYRKCETCNKLISPFEKRIKEPYSYPKCDTAGNVYGVDYYHISCKKQPKRD